MKAPDITVVSVYATDRIFNELGNWIFDQEGGPCLFIVDALQNQKATYNILTPQKKALVDIKIDKNGEVGTIKFAPDFDVDWSSITSPYILISTVLDEVNLNNIEKYEGNICIDVQGFVRKIRSDGGTTWTVPDALYKKCFCLKATEAELKYLPSQFIEKQKQNLLIVTKGSHGVEYWDKGQQKEASPKEVIACFHTLGAGDTFFANFVASLYRSDSVDKAIEQSLDMTSAFLKKSQPVA